MNVASTPAASEGARAVHAATTVVDRYVDQQSLVRLAFQSAQVTGDEPYVHLIGFDQAVAIADVLPDDAVVERSATTDSHVVALARCSRGSLLVSVFTRSTSVIVSAADEQRLDSVVADVLERAPHSGDEGTVPIRTWHMSGGEPRGSDRRIAAPSFDEIAGNYPTRVRANLERLFAADRPTNAGKLILWHGDPGTGKTTAVRALLRHWRDWCAGQYIADPEQLFAHPGYIADVLTRSATPRQGPTLGNSGDPEALWRLIIAEDCDEYLRATARRDAGAGLGRLLNLADGILGQGFNTLILLTTNEELGRLHPALTRPGRCLAKVEFTRFEPSEARAWLSDGAKQPDGPATLAELFERRGDFDRIGAAVEKVTTGAYL